jgi:hypothetical protein
MRSKIGEDRGGILFGYFWESGGLRRHRKDRVVGKWATKG